MLGIDGEMERKKDGETERLINRETVGINRQMDRKMGRQIEHNDVQTEGQTD